MTGAGVVEVLVVVAVTVAVAMKVAEAPIAMDPLHQKKCFLARGSCSCSGFSVVTLIVIAVEKVAAMMTEAVIEVFKAVGSRRLNYNTSFKQVTVVAVMIAMAVMVVVMSVESVVVVA